MDLASTHDFQDLSFLGGNNIDLAQDYGYNQWTLFSYNLVVLLVYSTWITMETSYNREF